MSQLQMMPPTAEEPGEVADLFETMRIVAAIAEAEQYGAIAKRATGALADAEAAGAPVPIIQALKSWERMAAEGEIAAWRRFHHVCKDRRAAREDEALDDLVSAKIAADDAAAAALARTDEE